MAERGAFGGVDCGGVGRALAPPPSSSSPTVAGPSSSTSASCLLAAARQASSLVSGSDAEARRRWAAMSDEALAREVDALRDALRALASVASENGARVGPAAAAAPPPSSLLPLPLPLHAAQQPPPPPPAPAAAPANIDNNNDPENDDPDDDECWRIPPNCIPIQADVRAFDWARLASASQFDAVLMDPPWQLATANPTRGVTLSYDQLSDAEILRLPVPQLQRRGGFLFVWVINAKYKFTLDLFDAWGYALVDEIVWVKSTVNRRLAKSHGYYLQHAKETCLVGFRANGGEGVVEEADDDSGAPALAATPPMPWELAVAARMRGGSSSTTTACSDVIFAERRGQSQKPTELHQLVEATVPTGRYLEIFARKNNLRDGWVSIGNEVLGPPR